MPRPPLSATSTHELHNSMDVLEYPTAVLLKGWEGTQRVPKQVVGRAAWSPIKRWHWRHGDTAGLPQSSLSILSLLIPPQLAWNCRKPGLSGATMVDIRADLHRKLMPVPWGWNTRVRIKKNKRQGVGTKLSLASLQDPRGGFYTLWFVIRWKLWCKAHRNLSSLCQCL